MLGMMIIHSVPLRVIIDRGKEGVCLCGDKFKGDLGTSSKISNAGGLALAGLFIIQRPIFHITVLKCTSLYAS